MVGLLHYMGVGGRNTGGVKFSLYKQPSGELIKNADASVLLLKIPA